MARSTIEKDLDWSRRVLGSLLGTWGRKSLMEEEEGTGGGTGKYEGENNRDRVRGHSNVHVEWE